VSPKGIESQTIEEGRPKTVAAESVLAKGAKLTGTVVAARSLRVDGEVEGRIEAEGDVTLSPRSRVSADIQAQNVTVAGQYKGNITVKNRAELAKGASVEGNITCQDLVVAAGAWFEGQLTMGRRPESSTR
jgi:cytoskeletal protein CcmA (bactofilin family)